MSQAPPPYSAEKAGPPAPYPDAQAPPPAGYPPAAGGYPQQPPPAGYPQQPPPAGYPQQPQPAPGAPSTVVVTQPATHVVVTGGNFGTQPCSTVCPHCHAQIVTAVDYEVGGMAWLLCLGLCVIGCDLGCCFIPFCVNECKDVVHTCPNCKQHLATHKRL